MSQQWKSPQGPVNGMREGGRSPFRTPTQTNISPRTWSSPHHNWHPTPSHSTNWSPSQSNWSPQHYNSYSSPNTGYWGSQQPWSPNRRDPASNYHRSWGSTPKTPKYAPFYNQSPKHGSVHPERKTQVHFRRNPKDISHYYSPSMVEDPWRELEAKATESEVSK